MQRAMGSMAAIFAWVGCSMGCSQAPTPPPATRPVAERAHDHGHAHHGDHHDHDHGAGPHDGTLADWGGGKYHVEFTVDHGTKQTVVYVLGSDEKTPTPVQAADGKLLLTIREPAFQVELSAQPLPGEAEGASSRYGGRHDNLGIVRDFAGTISGEVNGTPFAGEFAEEAHSDHEHP